MKYFISLLFVLFALLAIAGCRPLTEQEMQTMMMMNQQMWNVNNQMQQQRNQQILNDINANTSRIK